MPALLHDRLAPARIVTDATRLPSAAPRSQTQLLLNELESLRVALPEEETLLLLDETPAPSVARGLFGRLRDELWELPITWCVAADARDRAAYVEAPADAFWRRVLTLPPLTPAQARELLRARATEIELPEGGACRGRQRSAWQPSRLDYARPRDRR